MSLNKKMLVRFAKILNEGEESIRNFLEKVKKEGISLRETFYLTLAMNSLSKQIQWPEGITPRMDLPSTGGVGNITPIVVSLLLASTEKGYVPKVSTRSLTHTGGTIDILESVGYKAEISLEEMQKEVSEIGISIVAHDKRYTPIDSMLVSLRKETGTIRTPQLIASSIMNNKWIFNLNAVLLDGKMGEAGSLKDEKQAKSLAKTFVCLGKNLGIKSAVAFTENKFPQSMAVGNRLAMYEIVKLLSGKGEKLIQNLCLELASHLLLLAGVIKNLNEGKLLIKKSIEQGKAMEKFRQLAERHRVKDLDFLERPKKLLSNAAKQEIKSEREGFLSIDGVSLNKILRSVIFTNGKLTDYDAGVLFHKRGGEKISKGEPILTFFIGKNNPQRKEISQIVALIRREVISLREIGSKIENLLLKIEGGHHEKCF